METIRCPHCGDETPLTEEQEFHTTVNNHPFRCLNCNQSFGEIDPMAKDSAENQCDTFKFSLGGYFGDYKTLTFLEKDGYAELIIAPPYSELEHSAVTFRTTLSEWRNFKKTVFQELFVLSWTGDYNDPDVLDGTQWKVRLEFDSLKTLEITGSNRYPVYYDSLVDLTEHYFRLLEDN